MFSSGRSGRRSGSFNETACLIPKELLGDKILKNIRTTRMQRVIEKRQSLPARSSALVDDDGVPDRLAFSPAPVTVPQVLPFYNCTAFSISSSGYQSKRFRRGCPKNFSLNVVLSLFICYYFTILLFYYFTVLLFYCCM